ncbi:DUF2000 family protein [Mumia sp. ZJ430]|uniref:DUF2000 family protein n=1 Tax=Mumia sp. ZJ430 TaxID=2708083 RepID=UPI001AB02D2C|nr:DUF2000 family protein [Mumia sp. ZJ430]
MQRTYKTRSRCCGDAVREPYEDADGQRYLPMMRQPMLVFTADAEGLRGIHGAALRREMPMAIYTRELFATVAVHGPRNGWTRR